MAKRRLYGKQPPPEEFRPEKRRKSSEVLVQEPADLFRMLMGMTLRASDGILGRARAFSYLLLCSDAHYDVQLLSQMPRPVLEAVLAILVDGVPKDHYQQEEPLRRGRLASLPCNVVTKSLGGVPAYQVRFMWHDLKVESVWTANYSQAMDWQRSLSCVRKAATDRIAMSMSRKEDPKSIVPLTVAELAEAFVLSPSLELTFVTLGMLNGKRISTLYSSNYRLALKQWQGLRALFETHKYSKPKELEKIVESFRSQATRMVELEKLRFASRERHLIACVSGAIERGNVKVSRELHRIIGINDLCISADEIAARIQEMWLSKSAWIARALSRMRRHGDRQLTSEVTIAEMFNQKVEAEETKIVDLRSQLSDVNLELHSEKQEVMNRERKNEGFLEKLIDKERNEKESEKKLREKDRRIEYLESETERLRDDRNEQRDYCQQLYEELWGTEEYPEYEGAETGRTERAEATRAESSDKPKISRKEADK
eukprot:symbB.v1.2.038622.t1/scaffold6087.1/size21029/2